MPTIKENLLALRSAIVAEPEDLFDLHEYIDTTPCGTLHCSAGLAATMPFFIKQLSKFSQTLDLHLRAEDLSDSAEMWGPAPFIRLFERAGLGTYDEKILEGQAPLTDKMLAIRRIDVALAELEQV